MLSAIGVLKSLLAAFITRWFSPCRSSHVERELKASTAETLPTATTTTERRRPAGAGRDSSAARTCTWRLCRQNLHAPKNAAG